MPKEGVGRNRALSGDHRQINGLCRFLHGGVLSAPNENADVPKGLYKGNLARGLRIAPESD